MSNGFLKAIEFTLPWEAGKDKHGKVREDGGLNYLDGEVTKWGIYKTANPDLDVANLTIDQAILIYKQRYWDAYLNKAPTLTLDDVPIPYAVAVFDTGVNCGVNRCFKWHLEAIKTKDPVKTLLGLRDAHYTNLLAFDQKKYGRVYKGWINRLNDLKKYCTILALDIS